jgi:carbamate kinase
MRIVAVREAHRLHGVGSVVDKDRTVVDDQTFGDATPKDLEAMDLPAGSMGPKAAAAGEFAEHTGRRAAIGSLADAAALVTGGAGTQVRLARAAVRSQTA